MEWGILFCAWVHITYAEKNITEDCEAVQIGLVDETMKTEVFFNGSS